MVARSKGPRWADMVADDDDASHLDRAEAALPGTPELPGTPPDQEIDDPELPLLREPAVVCYSERPFNEMATLREQRMSDEQRQRYLDLQCHDPVDAPLCEDDPEPPEARASTDTRPWPQGQGPIVFCLMCEDRVQQLVRDCCPNCALQDVMISLEDPLAVELLAQERDIHNKLILSHRLLRLIARTTVEQVPSRRRVKLEPDAPPQREIRRCGFAPDSQ